MKLETTVLICAALLLQACDGWNGAGKIEAAPLPEAVEADTPRPGDVIQGLDDWEVISGRLGDELLQCRAERGVAVGAYQDLRAALRSASSDALISH